MKRLSILLAIVASLTLSGSVLAGPDKPIVYSTLAPNPLHGNMPSLGAEAYGFVSIGQNVTIAAGKSLSNVVVTMSSWGCESGSWYAGDCVTTPGATFSVPITLTVAGVATTRTFDIPYRPSASPKCLGEDAGKWFDNALKGCFNGYALNVTFPRSAQALPTTFGVVIAYSTSHYGPSPIGEATDCYTTSGGCGYDSLNVALAQVPSASGSAIGDLLFGGDPQSEYSGYYPAFQIKAN
ncbi:MAG TPA: hypothetical protein VGK16_15260 [Candidatus Limnocylindrales bacterium]|jgi:hypothetical protein